MLRNLSLKIIIIIRNRMIFKYNDKDYKVIVVKKNNKNTYIRIKDGCVCVTTNYFVSNRSIDKLLKDNYDSIIKMIDKYENKLKSKEIFYLFGKRYNIIFTDANEIDIDDTNIYIKNDKEFKRWLDKYISVTFSNHLKYWYDLYEESIPIPNLKIRKMKSRWGVCNTKNHNVTLNYELYRYDIDCLDYVIVHELSHFIEPNHSKEFWKQVSKYYPNYKETRKILRN